MEGGRGKRRKKELHGMDCDFQFSFIFPCRNVVKDSILDVFAGPSDTGSYSPSVQVSSHWRFIS